MRPPRWSPPTSRRRRRAPRLRRRRLDHRSARARSPRRGARANRGARAARPRASSARLSRSAAPGRSARARRNRGDHEPYRWAGAGAAARPVEGRRVARRGRRRRRTRLPAPDGGRPSNPAGGLELLLQPRFPPSSDTNPRRAMPRFCEATSCADPLTASDNRRRAGPPSRPFRINAGLVALLESPRRRVLVLAGRTLARRVRVRVPTARTVVNGGVRRAANCEGHSRRQRCDALHHAFTSFLCARFEFHNATPELRSEGGSKSSRPSRAFFQCRLPRGPGIGAAPAQ